MQPKVGSEDKVIKTVAQFIDDLRRAPSGRRRLFRGQNTDQPLLPKIARHAGLSYEDLVERILLSARLSS